MRCCLGLFQFLKLRRISGRRALPTFVGDVTRREIALSGLEGTILGKYRVSVSAVFLGKLLVEELVLVRRAHLFVFFFRKSCRQGDDVDRFVLAGSHCHKRALLLLIHLLV